MKTLDTAARYTIVGLICAVVHTAIVAAAGHRHLHYMFGCLLSYCVVVVLGFALHTAFTFRSPPTNAAFRRYAMSMAANYPLMLVLLFVMCDLVGLPTISAAPIATVLLFIWNFVATRWAVASRAQFTGGIYKGHT